MRGVRLICVDFKRAVFSLRFLYSVLGVTAAIFMGIAGWLRGERSDLSVWYLLESSWSSGFILIILCVLPVFAFGLSYAAEWEQKADRYWLVRTGVGQYALSKVLITAVSGFLVVFLGIVLFILLLLPKLPFYLGPSSDSIYESLIANGHVLKGVLLCATHYSLSGSMAGVCSLWFSTLLPNSFAAAAAPLVIYNFFLRVWSDNYFPRFLPKYLMPTNWGFGIYFAETAEKTFGIKLILSLAFCAVMGIFARYHMGRRLLRE